MTPYLIALAILATGLLLALIIAADDGLCALPMADDPSQDVLDEVAERKRGEASGVIHRPLPISEGHCDHA